MLGLFQNMKSIYNIASYFGIWWKKSSEISVWLQIIFDHGCKYNWVLFLKVLDFATKRILNFCKFSSKSQDYHFKAKNTSMCFEFFPQHT